MSNRAGAAGPPERKKRPLLFPTVHVEDIIFHMFQYIQKLRTEGPQEWVFQECKVGPGPAHLPPPSRGSRL